MISVCMTTYNGERFIKDQIDSIRCQLSADDEIIVSDDGSTDDTLKILEHLSDDRIKIFHHRHQYTSKYKFNLTSRNVSNALEKAKGEIIFLADQDDIWMPNKVNICIKKLIQSDLILHDCEVVDQDAHILHHSYFELNRSKKGLIHNLIKNSYLGCCMAMKKSVIDFALPFPDQEVPHDIWIGLLAEKKFEVSFLPDKLIRYRRHGENLSASSEKSSNSMAFKLNYRFIILKEYFKRIMIH